MPFSRFEAQPGQGGGQSPETRNKQKEGKGRQKKKGREKQSATSFTQLSKQQEGLKGETPDRETRRWIANGEPGTAFVATERLIRERGGLKTLRGSSSLPKEIREHFQK